VNVTMNIHHPTFKACTYDGSGDHPPFSTVEIHSGDAEISVFLDSAADCDALIKAACAAKDILHGVKHAEAMADPLAPLRDREHYEQCPMFWGTGTGETPMRCELAPYHAGLHENSGIEWVGHAEHNTAPISQAYVNTGLHAAADLASTGLTYSDAGLKLQAEIDAAVLKVPGV
jgi:hypothetical protein